MDHEKIQTAHFIEIPDSCPGLLKVIRCLNLLFFTVTRNPLNPSATRAIVVEGGRARD
jgi:hypothetical protein